MGGSSGGYCAMGERLKQRCSVRVKDALGLKLSLREDEVSVDYMFELT